MRLQSLGDAEASTPAERSSLQVRRVRADDIRHVIALDERVTGLAKADYWRDVFERYGEMRLHERFFLVALAEAPKAQSRTPILGFIIGEIRAWEFGSTPCGW